MERLGNGMSLTCSAITIVRSGVGRCVKDGSYSSLNVEWKPIDSIAEISYYPNKY